MGTTFHGGVDGSGATVADFEGGLLGRSASPCGLRRDKSGLQERSLERSSVEARLAKAKFLAKDCVEGWPGFARSYAVAGFVLVLWARTKPGGRGREEFEPLPRYR